MKRNTSRFLLLAFSLLLCLSCSDSMEISDDIVGQWEYVRSTRDGVISNENPCLLSNRFTMLNNQSLIYEGNIIFDNDDCELRTYDVDAIWVKREDGQGTYYSLRGESLSGGQFNYTYSHISSEGLLVVGVREDGITAPGNRVDYYRKAN